MKLSDANTLRERLNISRLALRHPRATVVVWVLVSLAGAWAYSHLRLALFPDVTFPLVVVTASAPGLSPQGAEAAVTLPIERRMHGLRDLKSLESTTSPGKVLVAVEFEVGVSLREARRRVDSALAGLDLPGGITPNTRPIDINESPVVTYVLVGEYRTPAQLMGTALGTFLPAIQAVPGVLRVVPLGVDPEAVAALGGTAVDTALPHTKAWLNGQQGVALEVVKEAGANTIEVVRQVDSVVRRLQWDNQDIHAVPAVTQADFIRGSTRATMDALWLAVALSVLVIFPFLRSWKATAISALAIPISLLGTFVVMKLAGFGLETLTLLALALVIGIIVDDAIVDVENIQRHIDRGDPPHVAAIAATDEIGLTVTAATLTIVAVFLPVGLMGGVTGIFFRPFGLTISAAVVTSLLVARTLSPLLSSWWLRPAAGEACNARRGTVDPIRRALPRPPVMVTRASHRRGAAGRAVARGRRGHHSPDPEGVHPAVRPERVPRGDHCPEGNLARRDQRHHDARRRIHPGRFRCGRRVRGGWYRGGGSRPGDPPRPRARRTRPLHSPGPGADPATTSL